MTFVGLQSEQEINDVTGYLEQFGADGRKK